MGSFLLVVLVVKLSFSLDWWKLRLIDSNSTTKNFLFRGPWPGGEIDKIPFIEYLQWKEDMHLMIKVETDIKVDDMYILDISFLHGYGEDGRRLDVEKDYFKKHTSHGEFIHWEVNGTNINATELSKEERDKYLSDMETWDVDKIVSREVIAHDLVHTKKEGETRSVVVFWHCFGGVDRTGEFSGGYYMKYFDWTFKECLDYDNKVKFGRPIGGNNAMMMNWYCYYLEKYEGKQGLNCGVW